MLHVRKMFEGSEPAVRSSDDLSGKYFNGLKNKTALGRAAVRNSAMFEHFFSQM
jgi:hypothetical protein